MPRVTKLRKQMIEKPPGWYWDVSLSWPPGAWFKWSSLDFRPAGEPLREWFFELGPLVILVGKIDD